MGTVALQRALRTVRPSSLDFWQQVAYSVGQSAEECQRRAFGSRSARCHQGRPRTSTTCSGKHQKTNSAATLGVLPKKDGPRRARRIRAFINARCFARGGCDVLSNNMAQLAAVGSEGAAKLEKALTKALPATEMGKIDGAAMATAESEPAPGSPPKSESTAAALATL